MKVETTYRENEMNTITCTDCGASFDADARIDGVWMYHGQPVGDSDHDGDYCQACVERYAAAM